VTHFAKSHFSIALALLLFAGAAFGAESALFWSLSRDGEPAGYLLGTIHSEDPRVLDFPDSFIEQMNSNRFFAMEMVPDLPTLARLTEYMHYQDGTRLQEVIGEQRFVRLTEALGKYRVPPEMVERMKVWAAMMTLSVPPPKSGFFMDLSLSLRASGAGLKVVGLETLEQQLAFLEDMPVVQQLELLDYALAEADTVEDVHVQLVDTYLTGDMEVLEQVSEQQMDGLTAESREYFLREGIKVRNRRMLDSLLPQLDEGTVFTAVGALHLPGEYGLVKLLRDSGFELEPLPLPFSASEQGSQPQ
jgi:uncharacterized protein YbaP (TraB family)